MLELAQAERLRRHRGSSSGPESGASKLAY